MCKYDKFVKKMKYYNQANVLRLFNKQNTEQKNKLIAQIENIDIAMLKKIVLEGNEKKAGEKIEPIDILKLSDIEKRHDEYCQAGIKAIREQKVGAVLLAGGQGSRLGVNGSKGLVDVGVTKKLYIFECLINNLLQVVRQADSWIPLYIMTSKINDEEIKGFLTEKRYFGYKREMIYFFTQDMCPVMDFEGRFLCADEESVVTAPNGNGGWFESMIKAGLKDELERSGIEWLNCFSIDNVLQKIADPIYIGAVIIHGFQAGAKVIKKRNPNEKIGSICKKDGRPSVVEYYELSQSMAEQKDQNGDYAYSHGVTLNYLFNVKRLLNVYESALPIHLAKKKVPYYDPVLSRTVMPEEENAFKFETLVLDLVERMDTCLAYEVEREREFAPIKNKTGEDSIESARELLRKNGVQL